MNLLVLTHLAHLALLANDVTGRQEVHYPQTPETESTAASTDTPVTQAAIRAVALLGYKRKCPRLFAVDSVSDELLVIDIHSLTAKTVGLLGTNIGGSGLDFSADGKLWGVFALNGGGEYVGRVDAKTGELTLGASITGFASRGVALAPDCATILVANDGDDKLYAVDPVSGQRTALGGTNGLGISCASLARSPLGYFTIDLDTDSLYRVSPITGEAIPYPLGALGLNAATIGALAFEPTSGQLFAWDNELDSLIQIDVGTMTVQSLKVTFPNGTMIAQIGGLAFEPTAFALGR